ncbi:hypothetical protein [Seonamhaeicola sp.]|uniref:hypothetical protein n=1 Tax=Seonamhaeicola sp. TaxID=1912245 RepID=UPI002630EE5E|nr:hypothetical protein [Seonamhaeicola sp.]
MSRQVISIFFSLVFVSFLVAPSIIVLVDDSVDISIFYTSSEEEEKGNEKNKDVEKLFFESLCADTAFTFSNMESELEYYYKKYAKPHLNLISPPPELT